MLLFARVLLVIVVAFAGWIGGSLYPAPASLIAKVSPAALVHRAQGDLAIAGQSWDDIQSLIGKDQAERLSGEAIHLAAQAGRVVTVEHVTDAETRAAEEAEQWMPPASSIVPPPPPSASNATPAPKTAAANTPAQTGTKAPPAAAATPAQAAPVATPAGASVASRGGFESDVSLCPGMTITNAPAAEQDRRIANFSTFVNVNGVVIAVDPIKVACFSSGFGGRHGHLHKGIDFYNGAGGPILAAADGTILEMKFRDDYGNMVLIDHGHGVYTRYAHLSCFHGGLAVGGHVHAGDEIGLMGNTAGYPVPLHLHYELLLGDYNNPKGSFGLVPHSPFEYQKAM